MIAGDVVRYRGADCLVDAIEKLGTPSGGEVETVVIRRPRAGEKRVLRSELELRDEKLPVPDPETFR